MENAFQRQDRLDHLGEQITELAGHLTAGEYRFLMLVEAFDREGGWHGAGIDSCAHWLNWRCGIRALHCGSEFIRELGLPIANEFAPTD